MPKQKSHTHTNSSLVTSAARAVRLCSRLISALASCGTHTHTHTHTHTQPPPHTYHTTTSTHTTAQTKELHAHRTQPCRVSVGMDAKLTEWMSKSVPVQGPVKSAQVQRSPIHTCRKLQDFNKSLIHKLTHQYKLMPLLQLSETTHYWQ